MQRNNQILKMLSPEETQLLGTLQSTISELLALQNAGGEAQAGGEPDIVEALKKLAGTNLGDNAEEAGDASAQAEEQKAQKENNGPTANEKAEQRSGPDSEVNDKNMSEVGKMLLALLSKNSQSVNKSISVNQNQPILQADIIAQAVAKALEPIANKITQMEQFNGNILEALGFSEKIEKSLPSVQNQNVNKGQVPIQAVDATAVVGELVNCIKSMASGNQQHKIDGIPQLNSLQETRKSLKDALPLIFQNNYSKNNR